MIADPADELSEEEAKSRMEDALRRALSTPHKPNQAFVGKKAKPESAPRAKTKRKTAKRPNRAKPKSA